MLCTRSLVCWPKNGLLRRYCFGFVCIDLHHCISLLLLPSLNHYSHTQWGQEEQLLFGKVGLYLHLLRFQAGSQWMVFSWAYPLTVPWAGEVQCPAMHQQQEHTTNISCPHSNELCSSSGFGTSVNYFATFVGSFLTAMDGLTRAVLQMVFREQR